MKKIIRKGTFETNSSSTHSLTWMTADEYDSWNKGELLLWGDELITPERADEIIKSTAEDNDMTIEEVLEERRDFELPVTVDQYDEDNEYLETDVYYHTTEHGDKIVAVCTYGMDC